jgi:hypothetical protein
LSGEAFTPLKEQLPGSFVNAHQALNLITGIRFILRLMKIRPMTDSMDFKFDFQTIPNRKDTGSLKWQKYKDTEILPM